MQADENRESRTANREMRKIGVLISGRGSNLQALIDAIANGTLTAHIAIVISNKADAAGLDRAQAAGIETMISDHGGVAGGDDGGSAGAGS